MATNPMSLNDDSEGFVRALVEHLQDPVVSLDLVEPEEGDSSAPVRILFHRDGDGGFSFTKYDLQDYWPTKRRQTQKITLRDSGSFIAYVKRHWHEQDSILFADRSRLTAVLNFGDRAAPGWGDNTATLELEETPEWLAWYGQKDKFIEQEEFADWLEVHAADVVMPDAAEVLEAVLTFRQQRTVTYGKVINLGNGNIHFEYKDQNEAGQVTQGQGEVPAQLGLRLRRYVGDFDPIDVQVLLRYRLRDTKLWFAWVFPSSVQRAAEDEWRGIVGAVAEQLQQTVHWGHR